MQKFNKGDLVQVADDLGQSMSHFKSGLPAIVIGSYQDTCGGRLRDGERPQYSIYFQDGGESAWYHEEQLTLIKRHDYETLEQWRVDAYTKSEQERDLDWIFAQGEELIHAGASGTTAAALARCFTDADLWGSHGEGVTYMRRYLETMALAQAFIIAKDKAGWLELCAEIKRAHAEGKC